MKILIIRLSSLGDVVLTQPVVHRIHKFFPEARIYYLTKEFCTAIVESFNLPVNVIIYQKSLLWHLQLPVMGFDCVFDLHNKFSSWLIKLCTPFSRHFTYHKKHRLRRLIIRHKAKQQIHSTLDLYASALQKAARKLQQPGLAVKLTNPKLFVTEEKISISEINELRASHKKLIALFPGAVHPTKRYPAECFGQVINQSSADYHYLLLGSVNDIKLAEQIHIMAPLKSTDLCGKFEIKTIIMTLNLADGVISNDSGPMHLAAALEKPQIAIFGATHPSLGFYPLNPKAVVLVKNLECQPCSLHGQEKCPRGHFDCMRKIKPDEIISALDGLFSE